MKSWSGDPAFGVVPRSGLRLSGGLAAGSRSGGSGPFRPDSSELDPGYMNLKPRPGHEREAFEDLLD